MHSGQVFLYVIFAAAVLPLLLRKAPSASPAGRGDNADGRRPSDGGGGGAGHDFITGDGSEGSDADCSGGGGDFGDGGVGSSDGGDSGGGGCGDGGGGGGDG